MGIPCVETTGLLVSCTRFSLLNSLQLLHLEVIVQEQSIGVESPSTLSPCLGDKAKFPGWHISNFFTRLKLWGLEGAGCVGSKVTADLKQWDL